MKPSKSHRNLPATGKRIFGQRQPPASEFAHLVALGRSKPLDRLLALGRSRSKAIDLTWRVQVIAFAVIDAGHPIGANESMILSVLHNLSIRCSKAELRSELCDLEEKGIIRLERLDGAPWLARLVGPATGIAEGDGHTAARTAAETPDATKPRPVGKVPRADSRGAKRVSR